MTNQTVFDWRAHLPVHPAAELFPLMPEAELKELAADIQKNGMINPVILFETADNVVLLRTGGIASMHSLLPDYLALQQSRRRLPQVMIAGSSVFPLRSRLEHQDRDPHALALSYNIHRRHLTTEQKPAT